MDKIKTTPASDLEKEKPKIRLFDPKIDTNKAFDKKIGELQEILNRGLKAFNFLTYFVIGVMLIGFLSLLFVTINSMMESWRFYSQTKQIQIQENIIRNDVELMKSINDKMNEMQKYIQTIKKQ